MLVDEVVRLAEVLVDVVKLPFEIVRIRFGSGVDPG